MTKDKCYMTTYTGKLIDPLDPDPDLIDIKDIAHHLSLICRYGGACRYLYTVGQHSVLGMRFIDENNKFAFLLHDASEYILYDMVKAVKENMKFYKAVEKKLQQMIFEKFKVGPFDHREVKRVDYAIMNTEAHALMKRTDGMDYPEPPLNVNIMYWPPQTTELHFLYAFKKYKKT